MKDHVSLKRRWVWLSLLLVTTILTILSSGCAPKTPEATPWPTRTPTPAKPTATPYQVASAVSLPELAYRVNSSNCIDCHTNQELLQAVAAEPEVVEVISEGEG